MDPRTEALDGLACQAVALARRIVEASKPGPLEAATILRAAETVAHAYRSLAAAMQLPGAHSGGASVLEHRVVRNPERAHELEQLAPGGHRAVEAR